MSSFDFVDFDEEAFSDYHSTTFNKFPKFPQISPHLPPTPTPILQESSIFLRSTNLISSKKSNKEKEKFEVILPNGSLLRFDPKGLNYEGRDSKVFRGEIVIGDEIIQVAVKVYKNDDESALKGAQQEIKIAQTVTKDRPDFLKLYYSGTISMPFPEFISVWEWIDGGTVDRFINNFQNYQIKNLIKSLAHSIAHLHSSNLVHHDLKPQNILVSADFKRVLIIDFGDSKQIIFLNPNENDTSSLLPLDDGIGLGTLAYTAPE